MAIQIDLGDRSTRKDQESAYYIFNNGRSTMTGKKKIRRKATERSTWGFCALGVAELP